MVYIVEYSINISHSTLSYTAGPRLRADVYRNTELRQFIMSINLLSESHRLKAVNFEELTNSLSNFHSRANR